MRYEFNCSLHTGGFCAGTAGAWGRAVRVVPGGLYAAGPSIVPEEAESSRKALIQLGVAHTLQLYPMDHGISADMQTDFLQWLAQLK